MSGTTHKLETFGTFVDSHYLLVSRPNAAAPAKSADGRHVISLTRLVDNEYRWDATVDFALGGVHPSEVAAVITRLIAGGEGRTEHDVLADLAASAPRTSAALGAMFSLDSLRPTPHVDGTTATTVGITVHADNLKRRFPALAEYVHRYLEPARYRFILTDRAGVPFLDVRIDIRHPPAARAKGHASRAADQTEAYDQRLARHGITATSESSSGRRPGTW